MQKTFYEFKHYETNQRIFSNVISTEVQEKLMGFKNHNLLANETAEIIASITGDSEHERTQQEHRGQTKLISENAQMYTLNQLPQKFL